MKGCSGILKERIKRGDMIFQGCIHDCRSGVIVEAYQEFGYDAILIDREHTSMGDETVALHIRLARALDIPVMVRVAQPDYASINRIMDQAPDGLYIPRIRTRRDVEDVVANISFPPKGIKGFGASTCAAGRYIGWNPYLDQVKFFSEKFVLGIQIETKEAYENIDDILSVPGLDVAVVGNDDLSLGLGIPGEFDSPEYTEAVRNIIAACRRHGVMPGMAGGDPAWVKRWKKEGMRLFWCASDLVAMYVGAKESIEAIRTALAEDE